MGKCYFCKGKTNKQRVTVDYRWGDKLVVIKNVPAEVCGRCGKRYFDVEVSRRMETIALSEEKARFSITIPVCEFAGAT